MELSPMKVARINQIEVSVCGMRELPGIPSTGITHLVSIWDSYQAENPEARNQVKWLFPESRIHFSFFNDCVSEAIGNCPPDRNTIKAILEFTATLEPGNCLLVHCAAGISRSTAIAFAALCQHSHPGQEPDCLHALKRIRPRAIPNPLIVEFSDRILRRNGAMFEALRAPGRQG